MLIKKRKLSKLLVISWGVYPSTGGSSIIVNNLAKGFSNKELVIAGQRPRVVPKEDWSELSDIKLYYLDPWPLGKRKGERYTRWLRSSKVIKDLQLIVEKEGVKEILAIFPDEFYCFVAMQIAKRKGIPFSVWFHNSYLENRSGMLKRFASWLQPKLFKYAKQVFVMSDGLNEEMSRQYPDISFVTLVHGFEIQTNRVAKAREQGAVWKFLYSGSLNDSCLDASIRMINALCEIPNVEIHVFSGNPQTFVVHGLNQPNLIFHDFTPLDEFVKQLVDYDLMLLPHGIDGARSDFEYRTIFPTRTIPLLFSGRPILAHSPEGSFLTKFLREKACAHVVTTKQESEIVEAALKIMNDSEYRTSLVHAAIATAPMFQIDSVRDKIVKDLALEDY